MQTRCVQIANTVFHSCHQCDNIDRLNKYKQQITNNLQLYSCSRSQHAHAIRVNWLNIITKDKSCFMYFPPSKRYSVVRNNNNSQDMEKHPNFKIHNETNENDSM